MKFLYLFIILVGCGYDDDGDEYIPPAPPPIVIPPEDKPDWVEMQALLEKNCVSCHRNDPFIQSAEALKGSRAGARLQNGSMPPNPDAITPLDRAKMIAFF